ncbi:MAG: ATP-binding cassette domain-containing protein [Frankiales bacterium]|nr:ATP-binding cassette domain-containing protein [Frankiales bacterium]
MTSTTSVATPPALSLRGVVKTFDGLRAVDSLDLDLPAGTCLGLLGPNGAGKSTTMRMLTGQAVPDEGEIRVLGFEIPRQSKQARARMGVVPQRENLDEDLTVAQNLAVWATLLRVPRPRRREAVDAALHRAQLVERAGSRVSTLSGGMRRRLLIARALVHDPALVLLDEPTVGLDPQVRGDIWTLIDALRASGVSVLMSTHYIEEAERLCDDVAVMSHGSVVARGAPATLVSGHAGVEALEYYGPPERLAAVEDVVRPLGFPTRRTGPAVSVLRAEALPAHVLERLGEGARRAANLEDVFVLLTGERLEGA